MTAVRVFISHAGADTSFAERLAARLREAEADVWLDATHLGAGDFISWINRVMRERDVLLLVLSPAAVTSNWVPDEMNSAIVRYKQGLMRAPVIVEAQRVPPADIPALWTIYNRIDMTDENSDALALLHRSLGLSLAPSPDARLTSTTMLDQSSSESSPPLSTSSSAVSTRTLSDSGSSEDSKIPNHHNDTLEAQKSYADGDILLRNSQYTEALAEFERAVALAPSWTEAWIQKGAALSHLQRNVDALDAYDRALVLNPNSALAWAGKAIVLKNLGRSDEAGFAARCAQLGSIIERRRGEAR